MRPIEFRGMRMGGKGWAFGSIIVENGCAEIVDNNPDTYPRFILRQVDPESIGQFTGMTDRNGVKIFEGDIVRWIYKPMPFKDTWKEYTLTVQYDEGRFFAAGGTVDADLYCNTDDMEVIGNAYEGVKK